MGYSSDVLSRARRRHETAAQEHRQAQRQLQQLVHARHPEIRALDKEIQQTMADVMAHALRYGEDPREAIAGIREKNQQLQQKRRELIRAAGYDPEQLDEKPLCSLCSDTGYVGERMCQCLLDYCKAEQRRELTSLLSLNVCFDDFQLDYYSDLVNPAIGLSPRAQMELVYETCVNYASHFAPDRARNLLMSGAPGLGKTFLSACIAGVVVAKGYSVVYDTAVHVFSCMEAVKFGRATEEERQSNDRLTAFDLLILDDLGTEMENSFIPSALYSIVNGRLVAGKPTIISTNLTMERIAGRYSPPVVSRLDGEYDILSFAGQDIRKLKKVR